MLEEAAKQTIPDMNQIGNTKVLLSAMELHILMLYLYYGVLGEVVEIDKGKALFDSLEKYIDSERLELSIRAKMYPKLCCIGIRLFHNEVTEDEQIILCEKAVDLMVRDRSFHEITNVLQIYISLLEKCNSSKTAFYKKQYEVFKDILETENVDTTFHADNLLVGSPKIYLISEYLLSKRREKKLTQEELSGGICEPETYSRIEGGKRAPSRKNFQLLAERLDINWCYYRGELDTANLKVFELRRIQRKANINGKHQESLLILEELEKQLDMTSVANIQYVDSNKCVVEYRLGNLSAEKTCAKLKKLLKLTQKEENDASQLVYYSQTELEIIGHIAQIFRHMKEFQKGIDCIQKVFQQMEKSQISIKNQWNGFSFLLRVLESLYFGLNNYEIAIEIARYVQNENVKRREGSNLIETLDGMADSFEHLGERYSVEYRKLYRRLFYVADFFKIDQGIDFAKEYYEKNFDEDIKWY